MTRATRSRAMRCIVIGAFLLAGAHAAFAQGTSPANPPPPTVPTPRGQPQAGSDEIGCPATFTPTGGAGLVTDVASAQRKNWQPAGGEITFTVRSFDKFNTDKRPIVCFHWRTTAANDPWVQAELDRVTLSDDHKTMQVTVTIPELQTPAQPKIRSLGIVPLADVGILLPATATGEQRIVVTTTIGITSVLAAFIGAIAVGALALLGLLVVGWRRLAGGPNAEKFRNVNPLLMVISTPAGYASLSQLQILLWTLVVIVSAAYVMLLSGDLIQITTGTLVLLGISGAATIGSKIHAQSDTAQATFKLASSDPIASNHPKPLWSDLITNLSENGQLEIDVTRVQMLAFTLITAIFVAIRVFTSYVIPDIPEGFQILMGISNSVYLGSKVAQKPPAAVQPVVPAAGG